MKYIVVSVRDRAADCFGVPVFTVSVGTAIRSFSDEVNRDGSPFYAHPEDFDLFVLGEYDDSLGAFECLPPKQAAIGKDVSVRKLNGS